MRSSRILVSVLAVWWVAAAHAQNPIPHVIIIVQENRTPDSLFHGFPGADIANTGVNSLGQEIKLTSIPRVSHYDLSHTHADFLATYDGGQMDEADKVPAKCQKGKQ